MKNLTNETLLDEMLLDKWIFTLTRVGRKNMTAQELWRAWLNDKNLPIEGN